MSNLNIANTTVNSGNLNGGRDERDSEPTGNSGFNGRGVRTESSQGKSRKRPRDEGTKIRENKRVKVSRDRKVEKGNKGDFSRYIAEAEQNDIAGNYNTARKLYLKAIALDSKGVFDYFNNRASDPKVLGFEKAIALNKLGYCYKYGKGTEVNFEKAFDCYKRAVEANPKHAEALYGLGNCYRRGIGTEVSPGKAFNCYKGAVEADPKHAPALTWLGVCYLLGQGTEVNFEKAFDCQKRAVEVAPKHAVPLSNLGNRYRHGQGTEVNLEKAFDCYKRAAACDSKYADKLCELGNVYTYDTEKMNLRKAFECYQAAVEAAPKHAGALKNLGYCYLQGQGTEVNPGLARFFGYLSKHIKEVVKAVPIFFIDIEKASEKDLKEAVEAYEQERYGLRHMGSENIEKQYIPLLERLYSLNKVTESRCIKLGNYYHKEAQYSRALACYAKVDALCKKEKRAVPEWIDNKKSFLKCLIALETKDAKAEDYVKLGIYYRDGIGVERNHKKAYEAFKNAFVKHGSYDYLPCLEAIGLDAKGIKKLYKRLDSLKGTIEKAQTLMDNAKDSAAWILFHQLQLEQIEKRLGGDRAPFMDVMKLLRDPMMKKWNVLGVSSKPISNGDWQVLKGKLISAVEYLYPNDDVILKRVKSFFNKTMITKDAKKSNAGMQFIRNRVGSIINYVFEGFDKVQGKKSSLSKPDKEEVIRKLKKVLDILADGGRACPDRAIVMLEKAESYVKIYRGKGIEYMPHVLVNLFKRNAIEAKLVPQNNQESIETYLYYLLKLNEYLGLGVSTEGMLYADIAQKLKTSDALRKVYESFTEGDLIGYVISHGEFQGVYKKEADSLKAKFAEERKVFDSKLDVLEKKYTNEDLEVPQDKKEEYEVALAELEGERLQMVGKQERELDGFFREKAEAMLLKAGFLTKEVWV